MARESDGEAGAGADAGPLPDDALLAEIEGVALELARFAGGEITAALRRGMTVEYKTEAKGEAAPTDPVSEVDRNVERQLRKQLAERFPDHAIVGEEVDEHPAADAEFVWAIDPVDGTTNFVNGFPLFACSIGVLHRGRPVIGVVWCSTSHELRPAVYHARHGSALLLDGEEVTPGPPASGVSRRLAAAPGGAAGRQRGWDNRVTGCASIECVFVAAGIFNSASFWGPGLWDVAAGTVLLRAAGREIWTRDGRGWRSFERFEAPSEVREEREPSLRDWRRPLLVGEREALAVLRERLRGPSRWRRLRRRLHLP
ncbi:MAG: inositol monophosphatase [Dehalococcoidia bacterium]|nr:inositol monophosphatase [Dehalococcoidia bacterium]